MTVETFIDNSKGPTRDDIHREVFAFLVNKQAVIQGAYAVGHYTQVTQVERETRDLEIVSTYAQALAEELKKTLNKKLGLKIRVREKKIVYQVYETGQRHQTIVNIEKATILPAFVEASGLKIMERETLIERKERAAVSRGETIKVAYDRADLLALTQKK